MRFPTPEASERVSPPPVEDGPIRWQCAQNGVGKGAVSVLASLTGLKILRQGRTLWRRLTRIKYGRLPSL
jgi:hypothetical protein